MNRNEAIEKSAQLFLQVLEHNDNRLTDSVFDYINILREALAMPKADAEPDAWLHHIVDPDGFVPDMRVSFSDRAILHEISREPLYTHPPQANAERVALRDAMKRNDLIGRIDEVGDGERHWIDYER